jgi:uncharacterized protein (TIGR02611 family)
VLRFLTITYQWARRCVIAVIGVTVVLIGVAMIVLPGPAFVVIPAGLAILGLEFAFARRWLQQLRERGSEVVGYTIRRFRWFRRTDASGDDLKVETSVTQVYVRRDVALDAKANTKTDYSQLP